MPNAGFVSRSGTEQQRHPGVQERGETDQPHQPAEPGRVDRPVTAAGSAIPERSPRYLGSRQARPRTTNESAIATAAPATAKSNGIGRSAGRRCRVAAADRGAVAVSRVRRRRAGEQLAALVRLDLNVPLVSAMKVTRRRACPATGRLLVVPVHVQLVLDVARHGDLDRRPGVRLHRLRARGNLAAGNGHVDVDVLGLAGRVGGVRRAGPLSASAHGAGRLARAAGRRARLPSGAGLARSRTPPAPERRGWGAPRPR